MNEVTPPIGLIAIFRIVSLLLMRRRLRLPVEKGTATDPRHALSDVSTNRFEQL